MCLIKCDRTHISPLHLFVGRGRQMDAYVDDLFDPVLDQGPPVSGVMRFILLFQL